MFYNSNNEKICLVNALINHQYMIEIINCDDDLFYDDKHRTVFRCIKNLYNDQQEINLLSLRQELQNQGELEKIGGDVFLAELIQTYIPAGTNQRHVLKILESYEGRRKLKIINTEITDDINDKTIKNDDIIKKLETTLHLFNVLGKREEIPALKSYVKSAEDILSFKEKLIESGYHSIDKRVNGFYGSELTVIAARPGVGKTTFALNLMHKMSKKNVGLFFSVEMPERQIIYKLLGIETNIEVTKFRTKKLYQNEIDLINSRLLNLHNLNLKITNKYQDINSILSIINKLYYSSNLDYVFIDYLQLIKSTDLKQQRYQQIGSMTRALKLKANELNIPIIVLAQLRRMDENKPPQLADLRESGDIEQDADNVMLLWPDEEDQKINVAFAKQRLGPTGTFKIHFDKKTGIFSDIYYDLNSEKK